VPRLFGTEFQNPVLLAAGTCGFGAEVASVIDLEALGGLVTKSVTLEPRWGNAAPRVTEFGAGMLNSVGLANPGVDVVCADKLPWLAANLRRARVFVSLAGHTPDEYPALVERLDGEDGFLGYELNLSCPNDARRGGLPFALDPEALVQVVMACRSRTERPLLAKLAPNDPRLTASAARARDAGADGLTLVNTIPGRVLRPEDGEPVLGAGSGGVSGPALRPVGVHAVAAVRAVLDVPLVGVGGVGNEADARQYLRAGASLVQIGTAALADPRAPARVARALARDPATTTEAA
jgi:dihydroorotate dehydrogenase (NAD+) catalytic subunit